MTSSVTGCSTFALAEVDHVAVLIAEDLDFDVAGVFDELLNIDAAVAEGSLGFGGGGFEAVDEVIGAIDASHAFAASTGDGFEHDGEADGSGKV